MKGLIYIFAQIVYILYIVVNKRNIKMTHTDVSSKSVEIEKWDVHGVLRGDSANDFGRIEAQFGILAERLRMIGSSLQTNEQPTEWDFDRLQEAIAIAKEGEAITLGLFKKLNYTVTTKREI